MVGRVVDKVGQRFYTYTMSTMSDYRKRKELFFVLLGNQCVQCGSQENLEFDHIDPGKKKFSITRMWGYSFKKVMEELKKCQLLCHECHQKKTNLFSTHFIHGTLGAYRHHKCRCDDCRRVWNEATRRWKKH